MQLEGELPDLVQKQGGIRGVLEVARARGGGAGERPLGVAEQRGFHQRRRNRCAVEGEEGARSALAHAVQRRCDDLLAAAGFAFDQHREGSARELPDLLAQLLDKRVLAEQSAFRGRAELGLAHLARAHEQRLERLRLAGFGHELDRAESAGVASVGLVVLPRQHHDLDAGGIRDQLTDQPETLVGAVRGGWQPEIDQRELGRVVELAQQAFDATAGVRDVDGEVAAQHEVERVRDQRIVVDDQQIGFRGFSLLRLRHSVRALARVKWRAVIRANARN